MLNLNNVESTNINSLLIECSPSMTQVFSYIKDKEIDESKIPYVDEGYVYPEGSVGWYKPRLGIGIAYVDRTNATYDYIIFITTHGYPSLPGCCTSNPVKECVCTIGDTDIPCIGINTSDKAGNPISDTIPQTIMDNALKTLPIKSNIMLYIGIGAVIVGAYYISRKK